ASFKFNASINLWLGAFHDSAQGWADLARTGYPGVARSSLLRDLTQALIGEHDLAGAREAHSEMLSATSPADRVAEFFAIWTGMKADNAAGDYAGVLSQEERLDSLAREAHVVQFLRSTTAETLLACAEAKLGRFAAAQARIAATPGDCYDCLIAR